MATSIATLAFSSPASPADRTGRNVWLRSRHVQPPRPNDPRVALDDDSGDHQGTVATVLPGGPRILIASPVLNIDDAWPGAKDGCPFLSQPDHPGPVPAGPRIAGFARQPWSMAGAQSPADLSLRSPFSSAAPRRRFAFLQRGKRPSPGGKCIHQSAPGPSVHCGPPPIRAWADRRPAARP